MTITILFFAHYADRAGGGRATLQVPAGSRVADCAVLARQMFPTLPDLMVYGRAARNAEFAEAEDLVADGDEIAFLPPVSGGRL